jgi:hypothetical protein
MPSTKKRIFIRHLTLTTKGADPATDVTIDIKDNGTIVYPIALRAGSVFGVNADFGKGIPIRAGDCTIVVGAAGASCITVLGVVYEII